ncbi:MAG: FAD-dependent oxidoreductase [Planctomycetes bacterium]|nr:FAD-dependent oxidoreductase [Planctomycetota bacterium]
MVARVVVLGGGPGGTVVANRLARRRDVEVTLVDNHGRHLYQPGLLYLTLQGGGVADYERDEASLLRGSVRLRVGRAKSVDVDRRAVALEDGALEYDWLVLATGSRVFDAAIPGLREFGHHFHCPPAAERLQARLAEFRGGRVVVGVGGLPYKCPPVPIEFALLFEDWLRRRGLRDRTELTYLSPLESIVSRPEVSAAAAPWLEERGIGIETSFVPVRVEERAIVSASGKRLEYDLLVLVPPHRAAPYLRRSALADASGFVAADRHTLRVRDRVYALGDTADVPAPKTAAAALGQAPVVADNIASEIEGRPPQARYGGRVLCFLETGGGAAARIEFDYETPPRPLERTARNLWLKSLIRRFYFRILPLR